jgi:hypothetical protein
MDRKPKPPTDSTADLLALCREILACQEGLSSRAARVRPRLEDGAEADRVKPDLRTQSEDADRLRELVRKLGKTLRETRIPPGRQEEVRRTLDDLKARLGRVAKEAASDHALISRRGVRIPGVGGRPHPRKPLRS